MGAHSGAFVSWALPASSQSHQDTNFTDSLYPPHCLLQGHEPVRWLLGTELRSSGRVVWTLAASCVFGPILQTEVRPSGVLSKHFTYGAVLAPLPTTTVLQPCLMAPPQCVPAPITSGLSLFCCQCSSYPPQSQCGMALVSLLITSHGLPKWMYLTMNKYCFCLASLFC